MFDTSKTSKEVRDFLEMHKWELDFLFPGPEGFYPKKATVPHLHFTMQAPRCYLHYKTATTQTEINTVADAERLPGGNDKTEAVALMKFLLN